MWASTQDTWLIKESEIVSLFKLQQACEVSFTFLLACHYKQASKQASKAKGIEGNGWVLPHPKCLGCKTSSKLTG
jgi:hypothetical protein